ncbi:MAG TPA: hypothetical protein VLZ81_09620 [Blastocatellia bacterium]|nr:hypothetical protein [Blastocatellia bacterium]
MRRIVILTTLVSALGAAGCIRKSATLPQALAVQDQIPLDQLVDRINSYQNLRTTSAQITVTVTDLLASYRYSEANGALRLKRPESIRLKISAPAPFANADIADMASDGARFSLAVFRPRDKAVFVHGSNKLGRMRADQIKDASDPRLKDAGALANIRPQHITDAFIIRPIAIGGNNEYFREEDRETEPDIRPNKKGHFVIRTYYVLYVLERGSSGLLHLRRKFWFDRTQTGTPLVRQQTFEDGDGKIGSDVVYSDFFYPANSEWPWAQAINIRRPMDGYEMLVRLASKDSIEINAELPSTTFVLENTEHLKELDVDQPSNATVTSSNQAPGQPGRR